MADQSTLASQISIKIGGSEIQAPVMAQLVGVLVDQNTHLPHMFTLRFRDSSLELLDKGPFDLTKEVEILAQTASGETVPLMKGEITALEPEFREGMVAELVVRGYDKLHRLFRESRSRAFLNVKDSDLADQIGREHNLDTQIDSTQTVYDHVFQHNQTDLEFLSRRAWRIGYECFVNDGKLFFRKPVTRSGGNPVRWGADLISFHPRMTLSEQVDEVTVKGWDAEKQQAIVGRAQTGNLYAGVKEPKNGAKWAQSFGAGKLIIVDIPVTTQSDADALAAARLDEVSGAFIEADGEALRRPDIRAGQAVTLEALGERFSGSYLVTSAEHTFTPSGLRTRFKVSGTRTGLLSEQMVVKGPVDRWPGVVIAIVTNADDPKGQGRVKVKFPWITEDAESNWARVMGIGAGPSAGLYMVPAVGDEVLVAFEHGDFSEPFVLGGLWNGVNPPADEVKKAGNGEKPLIRSWDSIKGHRISMFDNGDKKIEIISIDGRKIIIDDQNKKITIKTSGVELTLEDNKLSVDSQGQVEIHSSSNLKLQSDGNIDIKASGQVNIQGSMINLN